MAVAGPRRGWKDGERRGQFPREPAFTFVACVALHCVGLSSTCWPVCKHCTFVRPYVQACIVVDGNITFELQSSTRRCHSFGCFTCIRHKRKWRSHERKSEGSQLVSRRQGVIKNCISKEQKSHYDQIYN